MKIPCTPFSPGSMYETTFKYVPGGDHISYYHRVDKFRFDIKDAVEFPTPQQNHFIWKYSVKDREKVSIMEYYFRLDSERFY